MHNKGGGGRGNNAANALILRVNAPSKFGTQNLYVNKTFHEKISTSFRHLGLNAKFCQKPTSIQYYTLQ